MYRSERWAGNSKSQKVQPELHGAPTSFAAVAAAAAAQLATVHFCRLFGKCLLLKVTDREGEEADRFFSGAVDISQLGFG